MVWIGCRMRRIQNKPYEPNLCATLRRVHFSMHTPPLRPVRGLRPARWNFPESPGTRYHSINTSQYNANAFSCTHHHANGVLRAVATFFDRFVDDDIHERIEATQNPIHCAAAVQLQHHSFVHESMRESGFPPFIQCTAIITSKSCSIYLSGVVLSAGNGSPVQFVSGQKDFTYFLSSGGCALDIFSPFY